jgi:anti-anti-sigma regulatory factor
VRRGIRLALHTGVHRNDSDEGGTVLRITAMTGDGCVPTLRVEGRIDGAQGEELSRAAASIIDGSARLVLDMSGVTFVDRGGVTVIHRLCASGAELTGCSTFIETLLNGGIR